MLDLNKYEPLRKFINDVCSEVSGTMLYEYGDIVKSQFEEMYRKYRLLDFQRDRLAEAVNKLFNEAENIIKEDISELEAYEELRKLSGWKKTE